MPNQVPLVTPCMRATETIRVSSLMGEPSWRKAQPIKFVIPVTHQEPIGRTECRLLWDDTCLYAGYRAWDKDIWSVYTEHDSRTCAEDCLELFLQPEPGSERYVNFEINALGTVYDACCLRRKAGGESDHRWAAWNCDKLQCHVGINGVINRPDIEDTWWELVLAIPFASLPIANGTPKPGDRWKFLASRYDYSIHLERGVELSASAPLSAVRFHAPEEWTYLEFTR